MRIARHVLLLILAYLIQTTWIQTVEIAALKPNLILLVLVHIALRTGPVEATLLGFGIGFLQDLQTPVDMGLNALLNTLAGYLTAYWGTRMATDNIHVQVAAVCVVVLLHDLLFYLGTGGVPLSGVPYFWLRYSLGGAAYTGLVSAVIYAVLLIRHRFSPA